MDSSHQNFAQKQRSREPRVNFSSNQGARSQMHNTSAVYSNAVQSVTVFPSQCQAQQASPQFRPRFAHSMHFLNDFNNFPPLPRSTMTSLHPTVSAEIHTQNLPSQYPQPNIRQDFHTDPTQFFATNHPSPATQVGSPIFHRNVPPRLMAMQNGNHVVPSPVSFRGAFPQRQPFFPLANGNPYPNFIVGPRTASQFHYRPCLAPPPHLGMSQAQFPMRQVYFHPDQSPRLMSKPNCLTYQAPNSFSGQASRTRSQKQTTEHADVNTGTVIDSQLLHLPAEELLARRLFREAAENILRNRRQREFSLEVIAYPLLCGGYACLLEKYVAGDSELQFRMVKIVEFLFNENFVLRSVVRNFGADFCRPNQCFLNAHKLKKIATSWVNQYQLDPFVVSGIYLSKCQAAIMYLFRNMSFKEQSMEAWIENVASLAEPFPDQLKNFIMWQLVRKNSANEVMGRLMELWNIEFWEGISAAEIKQIPAIPTGAEEDSVRYHQFALPMESIEIIDTVKQFLAAVKDLSLQEDAILGVDCEWNPIRTGLESSELALLQVATKTTCYLFDIFKLKYLVTTDEWKLLAGVFGSRRIKKLGFDAQQDLQKLKPILPGFTGSMYENGIIDLKPAVENLFRQAPDVFGFTKIEEPPCSTELSANAPPPVPLRAKNEMRFALSNVVEKVLGAPLAKFERMSNWESRPLREAQIIYAANDAYCLIQVYESLTETCQTRGIPFPVKPKHNNNPKRPQGKSIQHPSAPTEPTDISRNNNGSLPLKLDNQERQVLPVETEQHVPPLTPALPKDLAENDIK